MKTKHLFKTFLVLALGIALTGCATMTTMNTAETCANNSTNAKLTSGDYLKKVDNFIIIQDASSTMGEKWQVPYDPTVFKPAPYNYESKLAESKDLVRCLNNTLPDNFDVNAGLRGFGPFYSEKGLIYGMTDYTKDGLNSAILSIGGTGGVTPMANAITYGGYDLLDTPGLKDTPGPTAMILFSDGLNTDPADPAAAAAAIKDMYGNNICIYTVLIGNDPKGRATMQQIADAGKCGFATDSTAIGNAEGMDKFVTDVFLTKAMKKAAPAPAPVMTKPEEKITMTLYFEFDFDKVVIRPNHYDDAKKIADALNKYSEATALLEGHTDYIGTEEYNMGLSKRRAESVKKHVVEKFNINPSRISTVGYGESKPIATNKTDEGRQRNRRVVVHIE